MLLKWLFFEGKMRGIFSMLFGTGVILITSRAEKRGNGAGVADIFTRRNILLTVFGFLHGTFIWNGDILFDYGLTALLFLYPARKLKARFLIVAGVLLALTWGTLGFLGSSHTYRHLSLHRQAEAVALRRLHGQALNPADREILKQWQAVAEGQSAPAKAAATLAESRTGYWEHVKSNSELYFGAALPIHVYAMGDDLGAMLLGMGLFKIGFLTAEASDTAYLLTALIGFALSLPLYLYGILHAYADRFYFLTLDKWVWLPYEFTRIAGMLAIASVLLLLIKHGVLRTAQRGLAAVGRTAFSNYILTSLLCQFIFAWGPFKLYGKLEYYQLMYVVLAVWAVNLTLSTLWLRHYGYGPIEWLWRFLTYGKAQSMRLPAR